MKFRRIIVLAALTLILTVTFAVTGSAAVVEFDFEDGETGEWQPRGEVELEAVEGVAYEGDYSLLTTGRSEDWNGPSVQIGDYVEDDEEYTFSARVKLVDGQPDSEVIMTAERDDGSDTGWDRIAGPEAISEGEWIELSGEYTIPPEQEYITIYIESPDTELEYYVDNVTITGEETETAGLQEGIPGVADVYEGTFPIGVAVEPDQLEDETGKLVQKHFNSITAENVMKPETMQPEEGEFNFEPANELLNFARENEMQVHGHTLVWHSQTPDWFFEDENGDLVSKEVLFDRMKTHIETVMGEYRGEIDSWDVVNEVVDPGADETGGLRNSKWYQIAGEEYIAKAFEYAHEVDPDAELYINDYSTFNNDKNQLLYELVKRLKEDGVPVDGIGMQMHVDIESPSISRLKSAIENFASLGVDIQITELDMDMYTNDTDEYDSPPEELLIKQGYRYAELFDLFEKFSDTITKVTVWGFSDPDSWKNYHPVDRNNWPLLFDGQLQAKPAYWGVVNPDELPIYINRKEVQQETPVVDAKKENMWGIAGQQLNLKQNDEIETDVLVSWDRDMLYLFLEVYDMTENEEDSVEIFLDENNDKSNDIQDDDSHFVISRHAEEDKKCEVATDQEDEGWYTMEVGIPWETIQPEVGDSVGFDLKINDADSGTSIVWNDLDESQLETTANYGILELAETSEFVETVNGTPEIDAEEDAIWTETNEITTENLVSGSDGATATVRTLWDKEALYLYAEVEDDVLDTSGSADYEQDSIEIFVDENNDQASEYESDDSQYRVNYENHQSFSPNVEREGLVTATRETDNGYVVEAKMPWVDGEPEPGKIIGFDVQVNDAEDGQRESVVTWNDTSGNAYQNPSKFGNLKLVE
ncbi:MAG: endo-1,4-beta-xylanase [Halanaerobiaceae bacterium]